MAVKRSVSVDFNKNRAADLPDPPRPVFRDGGPSPILLAGQAPRRRKVHERAIPWNGANGRELRDRLGVDESIFYDTRPFAILLTGLCYPGNSVSRVHWTDSVLAGHIPTEKFLSDRPWYRAELVSRLRTIIAEILSQWRAPRADP